MIGESRHPCRGVANGLNRCHAFHRGKSGFADVNSIVLYVFDWRRAAPGEIHVPAVGGDSESGGVFQEGDAVYGVSCAFIVVVIIGGDPERIGCRRIQAGLFMGIPGCGNGDPDCGAVKVDLVSGKIQGRVRRMVPGEDQSVLMRFGDRETDDIFRRRRIDGNRRYGGDDGIGISHQIHCHHGKIVGGGAGQIFSDMGKGTGICNGPN